MKKKLNISIIVFIICFNFVNGQNLVPNPSFESYWECPTGYNFSINNWYKVLNHTGTPDCMNTCSENLLLTIPSLLGAQNPFEGNGYIGMFSYNANTTDVREYIQVALTSPLITDQYYHVSFYVSLAETANIGVNKIGAALTTNPITGNNTFNCLQILPQIFSNEVITDKNNWIEISGSFQAIGGEQYLTIGNFFPDAQLSIIDTQTTTAQWSYYYFDNISVTATNLVIDENDLIQNLAFPNPFIDQLNFKFSSQQDILKIQVYSVLGLIKEFYGNHESIDLSDLPIGIYSTVITTSNGKTFINRVVKK